jgi:acetolactate synthase-1/2/3 large subunit
VKMRVADYLTDQLYQAGGETVFLITGGMIMHLTDALREHGEQQYICCHHETAAVMGADAYGRFTGELGVAYVTAGPGALNTLTGVVGAYVDTAPCIIVAGQSKISQAKVTGPRQFALQGYNTLPIFERAAKYAVMLDDVARVKYEVEKCIHLAKSHRVGPVWIELPIDVQAALFDPDDFEGFTPDEEAGTLTPDERTVSKVAAILIASKRPCVLAGAGVRQSGAIDNLRRFTEDRNIPVITSRLGLDLIEYSHPQFVGHPGTYGDRAANFSVQNTDLLIVIGCRLGIGLVGYDFAHFAENALKVVVDVDKKELLKPSVVPDVPVLADAKIFFEKIEERLGDYRCHNQRWVDKCQAWKRDYPVDLPEYGNEEDGINSYRFASRFSDKAPEDALFLCDTGSCFHVHAQAFKVKRKQRHIITGGLSTMGFSPASAGMAAASKGKEVYCITGDGSFQFNLQELATITHYNLPIKTILFNNQGYLLIRLTQENFQDGRLIGESKETGVGFPDIEKIAHAYGLNYVRISNLDELDAKLDEVISYRGALICEVMTPRSQMLIPRVASKKLEDGSMVSAPYDDMFPFLPRDEYASNCVRDTL